MLFRSSGSIRTLRGLGREFFHRLDRSRLAGFGVLEGVQHGAVNLKLVQLLELGQVGHEVRRGERGPCSVLPLELLAHEVALLPAVPGVIPQPETVPVVGIEAVARQPPADDRIHLQNLQSVLFFGVMGSRESITLGLVRAANTGGPFCVESLSPIVQTSPLQHPERSLRGSLPGPW